MELKKLMESNIERAEIVLAVKGEIEDKIQRQSEILSNLSVDILGPLVDRIKAEHGIESAENFRSTISELLNQALQTLLHVKDQIGTETLKLTGDVTSAPEIADLASDDVVVDDVPEFDIEGDVSFEDDEVEPVPTDRAMKESVKTKSVDVIVESKISGRKGIKTFNSLKEAQSWLTENANKIKSVKIKGQ